MIATNFIAPEIFLGLTGQTQYYILKHACVVNKSTAEGIIQGVCDSLELPHEEVLSQNRKGTLAMARFIIIKNIHDNIEWLTLKQIGEIVGGKHHSTIIYALETYDNLFVYNREFKAMVKRYNDYIYSYNLEKPQQQSNPPH